jgi:hypothetical protein
MKSKTKLDPKVIQQYLIDHTEKFVVGLVAALFLLFAYDSFALNGYTKKPEELKSATDAASARIARDPDTNKPPVVLHYADMIDDARRTIDPGAYPMPPRLCWKPIAPRRLRNAPQVFAVEQLRAISGRGAVPAANGGTVGKRWVVVTGLVPCKKQLDEYRAQFEGAAWNDPHEDVPQYVGYFVQRAEVGSAATGEPQWSKFMTYPPIDANEATAKMGDKAAKEIADPRFVDPYLTSPMPVLTNATWGNEVVFPPQIPLLDREANNGEQNATGGVPNIGHGDAPAGPHGGGHMAPPGAAAGLGAGRVGPFGGGEAPKPRTEQAGPKEEQVQLPDYRLLRFFDFDVKPNKQYQYRIFLVLKNPNYGLDAMWLEDQELAANKWLGLRSTEPIKNADGEIIDWPTNPSYAKWSPPCTSGRVSGDMRLLGGPVVAAKGQQEINAEVRVLLWQKESGLNGSFHKQGLIRGTVLNFPGAPVKTPGAKSKPVDLAPNCILVDLLGGEPLPPPRDKPIVSPGLVLVMDESGNLVMHDEVAEAKEWDEASKEPERRDELHGPGPGPKPATGARPKVTIDPDKIDRNEIETNPTRSRKSGH